MFSLARSTLTAARRVTSSPGSLKIGMRAMSSDAVTFDLTGSFEVCTSKCFQQ
jgi:hypothetical protein